MHDDNSLFLDCYMSCSRDLVPPSHPHFPNRALKVLYVRLANIVRPKRREQL